MALQSAWEMYFYPFGDGLRAIVGFDVTAGEEAVHVGWLHGRRVVLFFDPAHVRSNGLPDAADSKRIGDIEETLVQEILAREIRARMVGRLTYAGRREIVYQTEEPEKFDALVEEWRAAQTGVETKLIDGEGWRFFDEGVKPGPEHWVQIHDRRVIDELVAVGTDPRRTHPLEFTFRGLAPLLVAAVRVFEKHGFELERHASDELVLKEPCRLELDRIWALSSEFKRLADGRGLKYEGWGTIILPPVEPVPKTELLSYDEKGAPQVVVCARCCGQVAAGATQCDWCGTGLAETALITLPFDEHALDPRVDCASCGKTILARSRVCQYCQHPTA